MFVAWRRKPSEHDKEAERVEQITHPRQNSVQHHPALCCVPLVHKLDTDRELHLCGQFFHRHILLSQIPKVQIIDYFVGLRQKFEHYQEADQAATDVSRCQKD